MRVFGNFEQPIFLELVKQIEYMSVPANQYLFKVSSLGRPRNSYTSPLDFSLGMFCRSETLMKTSSLFKVASSMCKEIIYVL